MKKGLKQFHLAVSAELYDAVRKAAKKENRSLTNFITTVLKDALKFQEWELNRIRVMATSKQSGYEAGEVIAEYTNSEAGLKKARKFANQWHVDNRPEIWRDGAKVEQ